MRDIVLFKSSNPSLLFYHELKEKGKLVEGKLKSLVRFAGRKVLICDRSHSLEERAIGLFSEKGNIIVMDLSPLYTLRDEERGKAFYRLSKFLLLLKKKHALFFPASFASSEEDVRTYREKVFILEMLGIEQSLAKKAARLLDEVDWLD